MMKQVLAVCGAMLLPLAACGGSDDSADGSDTQVAVTDGQEDAATATEAPPPDGDTDATVAETAAEATMPPSEGDSGESGGSGPSTATATIGGETYEFSTEGAVVAQCQTDMFGIFSVQLPGEDGSISIVALLEGTDPAVVEQVNAVQVSVGDEDWVADESSDLFDMSDALQPGMSQVDSVEIDGSTVSGTATFVRQLSLFVDGEPEVVTGTFEATCGEERIS